MEFFWLDTLQFLFFKKKDLGVGGAVFSSGLVAGAPSKLAQAPKAADLWAAPILVVLGLGRVVTVKATNYVEHASECVQSTCAVPTLYTALLPV